MNILWIVNIPFDNIVKMVNGESDGSGVWIENLCCRLSKDENTHLGIVSPANSAGEAFYRENVTCYPFKKSWSFHNVNKNNIVLFSGILQQFVPDVIHIWGSEYPHCLEMVLAAQYCGLLSKTVIEVQGLVSVIAQHYEASLPRYVINGCTLRDLIRWDNIHQQKKKFIARGKSEEQAFSLATAVIGRSDWDKACVKNMNPDIDYYTCNRIMRSDFYRNSWNYETCNKHSIFISQGFYPIKGLHYLLEALNILKKTYPDVHLYVSGDKPFHERLCKQSLTHDRFYGKYLKKLIRSYGLTDCVEFVGRQNTQGVISYMTKANVCVLPSAIEDISNSVMEAMTIGLPVVSSDVGGMSNVVHHKQTGYLYQHDSPQMLAYYISEIFSDLPKTLEMSAVAKKLAGSLFDEQENTARLTDIYRSIILKQKNIVEE